MVVYIDILIVVNFVITYFMLVTSSIISGYTYSRKRVVVSSMIGAFFCIYIFVNSKNLPADIAVKLLSLALCSLVAYWNGKLKNYFIQTIYFVILNILITGVFITLSEKTRIVYQQNMFYYMNINPVVLVIASAVIYGAATLLTVVKEQVGASQTYKADIFFKDFKMESISAYYDSGMKIKDVVSNKDIIMISFEKTRDKIPQRMNEDICNFFQGKYDKVNASITPVFFNTVSGGGMVPAIKPDKVVIEEKEIKNILIAFVQNNFSENVTAIFGADIKKQI